MAGEDFAEPAGWGHFGTGEAVMPGQRRVLERDFTAAERAALGDAAPTLGETTFDVYLNERAHWRNVPVAVWNYQLGGYQVLKKWLSYREGKILGRSLKTGGNNWVTSRRLAPVRMADRAVLLVSVSR